MADKANISPERLAQLKKLLQDRQQKEQQLTAPMQTVSSLVSSENKVSTLVQTELPRERTIEYNEKQKEFVELATQGNSCVLIGAAGTGKTTCMEGVATSLIQSGIAGLYKGDGHKVLKDKSPGIVICAFTRRAVANIRKRMPLDLKQNCMTIHALLEFEPVWSEIMDDEGNIKKTMEFLPRRNNYLPLSESIHTIIVEESSMVSGTPFDQDISLLFNRLKDACPHNPQYIFLGDIQQLPPVFGSAILGFKMLELPVVELTEVYRQALESPIIRLAHRILSGKPIPVEEFQDWKVPNKLTLHNWKKKIKADDALYTVAAFFCKAIDTGAFNIDEDIILLPFNKSCGTLELNKHIATHLAKKFNRQVYEVISGYNKLYFSVGDKVLIDKEDAIITKIEPNKLYAGQNYQDASPNLDYWGYNNEGYSAHKHEISDEDIDEILALAASDSEDRVLQTSHIIYYRRYNSDTEFQISNAGELNNILLGYSLTVHKSQGSEWRKVFCVFHQSHATMMQRELLYTAVTRAKEELYIICEPETFVKGIQNQKIIGNTLEEKAEFFKGKIDTKNIT